MNSPIVKIFKEMRVAPVSVKMHRQEGSNLRTAYFSGTNKRVAWLPSGKSAKAFGKNLGLHQAAGWIGLGLFVVGLLGALGVFHLGGGSYFLMAAGGMMYTDALVAHAVHFVKMIGKNRDKSSKIEDLRRVQKQAFQLGATSSVSAPSPMIGKNRDKSAKTEDLRRVQKQAFQEGATSSVSAPSQMIGKNRDKSAKTEDLPRVQKQAFQEGATSSVSASSQDGFAHSSSLHATLIESANKFIKALKDLVASAKTPENRTNTHKPGYTLLYDIDGSEL